jgi:hypothetical protein
MPEGGRGEGDSIGLTRNFRSIGFGSRLQPLSSAEQTFLDSDTRQWRSEVGCAPQFKSSVAPQKANKATPRELSASSAGSQDWLRVLFGACMGVSVAMRPSFFYQTRRKALANEHGPTS